jgi:hypothetical protein
MVRETTHKAATVGRASLIANWQLQIANCKFQKAIKNGHCETASGFNHQSSFSLQPVRRGISLMEVLISIFVLSIGLLGVAAIIPLGQMALWETAKADRSGACGRAAIREIQVSRLLDYRYWYWRGNIWGFNPPYQVAANRIADNFAAVNGCHDDMPFVVDPLGYAKGMPDMFGATASDFLPRRTLRILPLSPGIAPTWPPQKLINAELFFWNDDLPFSAIKNSTARPTMVSSISEGSYSWFFSAMPVATEMSLPVASRRLFNVSVVVCYKRNFQNIDSLDGEHTATIDAGPTGFPGMGIGGGTVQLNSSVLGLSGTGTVIGTSVNVKENHWVMLYHLDANHQLNRCYWYRVVGVGGTTNTLSLVGPDWDYNLSAILVVVPGAIGVYNTTMELDWDPLWTK